MLAAAASSDFVPGFPSDFLNVHTNGSALILRDLGSGRWLLMRIFGLDIESLNICRIGVCAWGGISLLS